MNLFRCVSALAAGGLLCFSFTGCEKTLQLRAQSEEIDAKLRALEEEKRTLEAQLATTRLTMPQAGSNDEAARILYSRAAGELTILEANLKTAAASLKETEAAVAALKQETAGQRPKAQ